jgi:hypothetical protein
VLQRRRTGVWISVQPSIVRLQLVSLNRILAQCLFPWNWICHMIQTFCSCIFQLFKNHHKFQFAFCIPMGASILWESYGNPGNPSLAWLSEVHWWAWGCYHIIMTHSWALKNSGLMMFNASWWTHQIIT